MATFSACILVHHIEPALEYGFWMVVHGITLYTMPNTLPGCRISVDEAALSKTYIEGFLSLNDGNDVCRYTTN